MWYPRSQVKKTEEEVLSSVKSCSHIKQVKRNKKPHTDGFPAGLKDGFDGMMRTQAYLGEI